MSGLVDARTRIYAVGDVHGRSDLLAAATAAIEADARARAADGRKPVIVLLGDYVDRGDDARGVLDLILGLRARSPRDGLVCLIGNHEAALLDFVADPVAGARWLAMGGRQTLASYGVPVAARADAAALGDARDRFVAALGPHLELLSSGLARLHRSGRALFAHAGFDPDCAEDAQPDAVLLWGAPARPLPAGLTLVHGHFDAPAPTIGPDRVGIDTGAYHSGVLTVLRLDDGSGWIAPAATGRGPAGGGLGGQSPSSQSPSGQNPSGQNPSGRGSSGRGSSGRGLTGSSP